MKNLCRLKVAGLTAMAVALGGCLYACGGNDGGGDGISNTSQGTAATVSVDINGVSKSGVVGEKAVTDYVADFRTNSNLESDDAWAEWMVTNGYTPETVRDDVIDYYVRDLLLDYAAEAYDVSVSPEEVDEQLQLARSQFESDEAWANALEASNLTEEEYKNDVIEPNLLQQKLASALEAEQSADAAPVDEDAQVVELANQMADYIDGAKRSSHILFDATERDQAEDVLEQLQAGTIDFADAAQQYSKDSSSTSGGDVGWDKLGSGFVTAYQNALDGLSVGEMSGLVETDYGYHIILCTDELEVPAGGYTSVSQIPADVLPSLQAQVSSANSFDFYSWFTTYQESATIEITPMPENLPYDVDLSAYATTSPEDVTLTVPEDATSAGNQGEPTQIEGPEAPSDEAPAKTDEGTEDQDAANAANGDQAANGPDANSSTPNGTDQNAGQGADGQNGTQDGNASVDGQNAQGGNGTSGTTR